LIRVSRDPSESPVIRVARNPSRLLKEPPFQVISQERGGEHSRRGWWQVFATIAATAAAITGVRLNSRNTSRNNRHTSQSPQQQPQQAYVTIAATAGVSSRNKFRQARAAAACHFSWLDFWSWWAPMMREEHAAELKWVVCKWAGHAMNHGQASIGGFR
jgi:hypothetical protein